MIRTAGSLRQPWTRQAKTTTISVSTSRRKHGRCHTIVFGHCYSANNTISRSLTTSSTSSNKTTTITNHHPLRITPSEFASSNQSSSWLSRVLEWYSKKLDTHPLLTKGISSGLIAGGGDLLCQALFVRSDQEEVEEEESTSTNKGGSIESWSWDKARTGRFFLLGTFLVAPVVHFWYGTLATRIPGTTVWPVIQRVGWDQFMFAPMFVPVWLTCLWTLEGRQQQQQQGHHDHDNWSYRLQRTVPQVLVVNWSLWIPAQAINFWLVQVKFQVLFSNIVALLWNVYLSYSQARRKPPKQQPSQKQTSTS